MVFRYNVVGYTPTVVTKRSYKRPHKNKLPFSTKKNVSNVTRDNKLFLQSLGFELLI